jgi:hypothetical protein
MQGKVSCLQPKPVDTLDGHLLIMPVDLSVPAMKLKVPCHVCQGSGAVFLLLRCSVLDSLLWR